ncbi:hypothetical protein FQA39_LY04119 [Lamprigera yunnana]|nr:hypothetical protein FQA39_LY04119 [Lamprigera yunnana]
MSGSHKGEDDAYPLRVFVRIRPFNENERQNAFIKAVNAKDLLINASYQKKLQFNGVFGPKAKQSAVYKVVAKPLIADILSGYNCTILTYGQIDTGKTYTMMGVVPDVSDEEECGLIPRIVAQLFEELHALKQHYAVRCSYFELCNEEVRDLLARSDDPLRIRIYESQRNKGIVVIQGVEEVPVNTDYDVFKLLKKGQERRHMLSTLVNEHSGRAHTIFTMMVYTRENGMNGEELINIGKFNLIDLAGSENINKSGAMERRAREGGNINQSLLTLGRVIKALSEKNSHVPFRESKLTRILQDSLGGKTKTSIIATISASTTHMDETLSTLDYAQRARMITNKLEVNQKMSQTVLIDQYIEENARLHKDLAAAHTKEGIFLDHDNYEKLMSNQQTQKEVISQNASIIKEMSEQLQHLLKDQMMRQTEFTELSSSFKNSQTELKNIQKLYERVLLEKENEQVLAESFRSQVEKLEKAAIKNNEAVNTMNISVRDMCELLIVEVDNFFKCSNNHKGKVIEMTNNLYSHNIDNYKKIETSLNALQEHFKASDDVCKLLNKNETALETFKNEVTAHCSKCINSVLDRQQIYNTSCRTFIEHFLTDQKSKYSNFLKQFEQKINNLIHITKLNREDLCTDIENNEHDIFRDLCNLTEILKTNKADDFLSCIVTHHEHLSEQVNIRFEHFQNCVKKNQKLIENNTPHLVTLLDYIRSSVSKFDMQLKTQFDVTTETITAVHRELQDNSFKSAMDTSYNKLISDYKSQMSEKNSSLLHKFENFETQLHECSDNFILENTNALTKIQSIIADKLEKSRKGLSNQEMKLNMTSMEVQEQHHDISQKIDTFTQHMQKLKTETISKMNQFNVLAKCTDQVIEIQHAGDTPNRSTYRYPSCLKELTPKDKVLLKFRRQEYENGKTVQSQPNGIKENNK